jgi:triosephosphate isomerase
MRNLFIAGNWKMNILPSDSKEIINKINDCARKYTNVKTAICPPFTHIPVMKDALKSDRNILIGEQNIYPQSSGAYTGEVSPDMLKDLSVDICIVGHSERRQYFDETNMFINDKVRILMKADINTILCIGETKFQRDRGNTKDVIQEQLFTCLLEIAEDDLSKITIAYEPVWAIGTGDTATPEQAQEIHKFIRKWIKDRYGQKTGENIIIQYGGSVNPDNAEGLLSMPDIDGALIGGASLKPDTFCDIIKTAHLIQEAM